jgi:pyochelin synthetase
MKSLLAEAARAGIQFGLDGEGLRITAPKGAMTEELRQAIRSHKARIIEFLQSKASVADPIPVLAHDKESLCQPFLLTDLQHAYWVGRDSSVEMGNISSHVYIELECKGMDIERLNHAFNRLIERHDVLRLVVDRNGLQRILPVVPPYRMVVNDHSSASPEAAEQFIQEVRQVLSHQMLVPDQWPLFDVRATVLPSAGIRLHVSLDLLLFDASSLSIFFRDWSALYGQPESNLPPLGISFRDYVLAEKGSQGSAGSRKAHAYWMQQLDALPAAPELPLRTDPGVRTAARFSRRQAVLEKKQWDMLKASAQEQGLTPSSLLLALYSEVLARWSARPHFTVNVTLSNRLPVHPDVDRLIGNFTTPVLHRVDRRDVQLSLAEFARQLQQRLLSDLEHREVSGVEVLREWSKRHGASSLQAAMPVVFSSALKSSGGEDSGDIEQLGRRVYGISQTSQVWLDHHVAEVQGDLIYNWDAVDAVFEEGVLDAMFSSYNALIQRLVDDPSWWERPHGVALPQDMQLQRECINQTAHQVPQRRLHAGFVAQALDKPQAMAILAPGRSMTYGELLKESVAVADWLLRQGIKEGQMVAVLMHKGWEQIVAVYGVLLAGGAYMPIGADLPPKRQLELLRIGEIRQILTQPGCIGHEVLDAAAFEIRSIEPGAQGEFGAVHQQSLDGALDALAYVIFTSGTTGVPKGVMIDHRGAANTVEHVNRLNQIGSQDRVLAVSSLSFDLSVYDIFGLLGAGGAVVIPDARKGHDPMHWLELLTQHGVTIWNSAPQLMQMLVDCLQAGTTDAASLRRVLLSGDFIPLDLPGRVRHCSPGAQVVSLGGATEASIWSISHPVGQVNPAWTSIPYGKPLPNQTIWVLDAALRPCPDHVKGRIFIGGLGLAQGYWRDEEKTAARFITHPQTGERLYDTGDAGCYAEDGNVFILGRDDGQVKIRGHRVELGEIEAVLSQHPAVRQVVVMATSAQPDKRQLAAYVELADKMASTEALQDHLSERLPDYMVPRHMVVIDAMPVSPNGKIDYQALAGISVDGALEEDDVVLPRNPVEQTLLDAWSRVITDCRIGVTNNFFELGGDSMLATQLVRELNAVLPSFQLEMHELFENLTIESLARLFQGRQAMDQGLLPAGHALRSADLSAIDAAALAEDVRSALETVSALDFRQAHSPAPQSAARQEFRAALLTGGTGWVGAHVLSELLSETGMTIHCLVRSADAAEGHSRLFNAMRSHGIQIDPSWANRVQAVSGDLALPRFGLDESAWEALSKSVDAIYHFGASLNVLASYPMHRPVNVGSMVWAARLATEHHLKPVFFGSPMAVCRRRKGEQIVILHKEDFDAAPEDLLTGYAQSKWAAEQVLREAAARGLPTKIYRTSHALPSTRNGLMKPHDTYATVLQVACLAGQIPDWEDAVIPGIPVDRLAQLIVRNSLMTDEHRGIVHLEHRTPMRFKALIELLLPERAVAGEQAIVSLKEWKASCLAAANRLPDEQKGLAARMFAEGPAGAAVEHMFKVHPVDTGYFDRRNETSNLSDLTPDAYWRMVHRHAGWHEA